MQRAINAPVIKSIIEPGKIVKILYEGNEKYLGKDANDII